MVQKLKKIAVVIIWILVGLLVGCMIFTGVRLAKPPKTLDGYKGERFEGGRITVTFTETGVWYDVGDEVILLEITEYKDGVITMERGETEYVFVAIDRDTLYDEREKELLSRRIHDG